MTPTPKTRQPARRHESGQAIVLLVFVLLGLLGFAALALDGGNLYTEQRRAQAAADTAVMAAAYSSMRAVTNPTQLRAVALAAANQNLYSNDGTTNWVEFYTPPAHGPMAGDARFIEVMITQTVPTALAHLVYGQSPIPLTVFAVAHGVSTGPIMPGYAIASFKLSCDHNEFTPRGGVGAIIKDGGVFVNSDPSCGESVFVSGNDARLATTTSAACPDDTYEATCEITGAFPIHIGGYQGDGVVCSVPPAVDWWTHSPNDHEETDCNFYPAPTESYTQILNPPAPLSVSDFTCGPNRDALITGGSPVSLQPGSYTTMNANGKTLLLAPGIYCITSKANGSNSIMEAGSIIGRGVFIYIADPAAEFKYTGGDLMLSAAFDGENGLDCAADPNNELCTVAGVILFKPKGKNSCSNSDKEIDFSGISDMVVRGLIWAPESFLSYTGNGDLYQTGQSLVGCVKYAGNGELDITYDPDETYSPPPMVRLDQ